MSILRDISRAKTLLKAVGSITQRSVPPGSVVVKQGDIGDSMYTVVKVRPRNRYASNNGQSQPLQFRHRQHCEDGQNIVPSRSGGMRPYLNRER